MPNIPYEALWKGPPTRERQRELETDYFCDAFNQRGLGYGAMFFKDRGRWRYFYPPVFTEMTPVHHRTPTKEQLQRNRRIQSP